MLFLNPGTAGVLVPGSRRRKEPRRAALVTVTDNMAAGEEVEVRAVDMWLEYELDLGATGEAVVTTWGPSDAMSVALTDDDEIADPDDTCGTRRSRRLRSVAAAIAPASEVGWYKHWQDRFECWWVATPYRTGMEACVGSLGLMLAARLEHVLRAFTPGFEAPSEALRGARAEQGCEWLEQAELALPKFPSMGEGFEFTRPPIPRLVPPLERLRALEATGDSLHAAWSGMGSSGGVGSSGGGRVSAGAESSTAVAVGAVAGLASASALFFAFFRFRWRGSVALRRTARSVDSCSK